MLIRSVFLVTFLSNIIVLPNLIAQQRHLDGKTVFENCAACHGQNGGGNAEISAPAIAGLPEWYIKSQLTKFMNGARGAHKDDQAGLRMRPMARHLKSEHNLTQVASYVAGLPIVKTPQTLDGNPLRGETQYKQVCVACHGPSGKGIEATGAPGITHQNDWYLLEQLQKFKNGIRAYNPALDPIGATMAPMAKLLADEQAMKDVIAYVKALEE